MRKIEYVMTKNVTSCRPDNNLAEVGALLWEHNCGAMPVLDSEERVIGIITDRDICIALTTKNRLASNITVDEVMSKQIYTCSIEDGIEDAIEVMRNAKVRRIPVVDVDKKLKGIITLSDILVCPEESTGAAIILKSIYADVKPLVLAAS
ncbi:MAG: CBS domain-containing protein [Acidobacteriota bacterium]